MFGPDIVRALAPDYDLRITDVTDRPEMRDEAQVMRYETKVPRPAHRRLPSVCGRAPSTDCLLSLRCQNTTTTAAAPDEVDVAAGMQGDHEWWSVDIADSEAVAAATAGTDLTIVLAVVHTHRKTGFDVNARGVFNACKAAAEAGHARLVNTGPWTVIAGHARTFHHQLTEGLPVQTGTDLYSFSKGVGHEISRVFSANSGLHVLCTLHGSFPDPTDGRGEHGTAKLNTAGEWEHGSGLPQPFCATFRDSAQAVRLCAEVPLARLSSRLIVFYICNAFPDGVFSNAEARHVLGWAPQDTLELCYTRDAAAKL